MGNTHPSAVSGNAVGDTKNPEETVVANSPHPSYQNSLASLCPVLTKKKVSDSDSGKPSTTNQENSQSDISSAKCPVAYKNPNTYNVYGQKIDPSNNMPQQAAQLPSSGQRIPLSTTRTASTIPKGGTDSDTWLYPSPQMFWNSLTRKNKTDGASEEYMDTVIAIHNNMNENTWRQVLAWEKIRSDRQKDPSPISSSSSPLPGTEPKLLRFLGRPHDISPKARLKMLFGHPAPFDRHDWFVDRGGEVVRYVIDYYHSEAGVPLDRKPQGLEDAESLQSIKVDVRPALDSFRALFDRVMLMPLLKMQGKTHYSPPPFLPPLSTAESPSFSKKKAVVLAVKERCAPLKRAVEVCSSDVECLGASMKLSSCAASIVCPEIAKDFEAAVSSQDPSRIDASFLNVSTCLQQFDNQDISTD